MSAVLPPAVRAWREHGTMLVVDGQELFVADSGDPSGRGPRTPVVIVHGFPGSSFDFAGVVAALAEHRRVVSFDLLGYGLSAKPPAASYSLFEQADLVASLLAQLGIERCSLVGHDMGDTVVAELLHRHNAGRLGFDVERVILTNGSIFIDLAQLTRGQRLALRLPNRRVPLPVPNLVVRRSLRESFVAAAPPPAGALDAMVALIQREDGGRLLPRQIRYIEERRAHQETWTAALVEYTGPLTAIWGALDPIAVVAMPRRLHVLRPATEIVLWPDVGHWPSVEVPERLAEAIVRRL